MLLTMMAPAHTAIQMSSPLEDYLETIYLLVQEHGFARVKDIARARDVKASTISVALRKLAQSELVEYERREYIGLTPKGEEVARKILTRHRLLTRFFEEVLKMPPHAASKQACAMEHSLTDEAMDRMVGFFEFLGSCPSVAEIFQRCPAAVPSEGGRRHDGPTGNCAKCTFKNKVKSMSIADLKPGQRATILQIAATGALRQRLLDMGILPETTIDMERSGLGGDPLWIRCQGARLALRRSEASTIRIRKDYEVTIVAAMILGLASFGHKGVIFPLLVRGIGVLGSIISTYTVKAGPRDTSDTALWSVHRGFWIGSIISIIGFMVLGAIYLRFDAAYLAANPMAAAGFPNGDPAQLGWWASFGIPGLDMRPALTCLIGVLLAIALNKVTSYFTHTKHAPVQSLARACQTGHATNIIQGFAVGYESTVASLFVIAGAILLSVLCYAGMPPLFIAFGVAMAGIGMLTLTGNTISMDVFGPVADNANGIGEMGYEPAEMERQSPGSYKRARQVLADLDAVGNTTKAETKGIAIGSAVIAAVSLFSSFIAVIAVGSEERIPEMTLAQYMAEAGKLTVAEPIVFIGFLLGGAVPFLFSSMLIRAVGRAAAQIVEECRRQFRDKGILAGTKRPDYGRVVHICTNTAQKELVGPGLLAIIIPPLVGFLLGPYAVGGVLAGMILVGQLLAVFMSNAGGAWDNAKKLIEDGVYGGKGSEAHKAAVTGDTVGDPLKDTAGPAINPLIKVMNMVSLLTLGLVLALPAGSRSAAGSTCRSRRAR